MTSLCIFAWKLHVYVSPKLVCMYKIMHIISCGLLCICIFGTQIHVTNLKSCDHHVHIIHKHACLKTYQLISSNKDVSVYMQAYMIYFTYLIDRSDLPWMICATRSPRRHRLVDIDFGSRWGRSGLEEKEGFGSCSGIERCSNTPKESTKGLWNTERHSEVFIHGIIGI